MHLKPWSIAKKLYFILTNSVYENFIIVVSFIYLLLTLLEPGNHNERPYEPSDSSFKTIMVIEVFC